MRWRWPGAAVVAGRGRRADDRLATFLGGLVVGAFVGAIIAGSSMLRRAARRSRQGVRRSRQGVRPR